MARHNDAGQIAARREAQSADPSEDRVSLYGPSYEDALAGLLAVDPKTLDADEEVTAKQDK